MAGQDLPASQAVRISKLTLIYTKNSYNIRGLTLQGEGLIQLQGTFLDHVI